MTTDRQPAEQIPLLHGLWSALLAQRGLKICAASVLVAPFFAFAKKFGNDAHIYAAVVLTILIVTVLCGFVIAAHGYRKRDREIERGYTSWKTALDEDNSLVGIDAYTLKVISPPELPK